MWLGFYVCYVVVDSNRDRVLSLTNELGVTYGTFNKVDYVSTLTVRVTSHQERN